jgi:hypothetical protein
VNINLLDFWMTLAGMICWGFCFWWMRRISLNQNQLLARLQEQGKRIEKLSKLEHDLIKEVHPQVGEIKEGMDVIIAAVNENSPQPAARKIGVKVTGISHLPSSDSNPFTGTS